MRVMPDRDEIRRACDALFEAGQVVELRALEATSRSYARPHTVAGWFDDAERLASAAASIQARGVYVTLNPLHRALLSRAANRLIDVTAGQPLSGDGDTVRRRWLPVDLDPVRPAGVSASETEHAAAQGRALDVAAFLTELGWPAPLVADSGNGAHLLYRVDLPPDTNGLVSGALDALAARFDDAAVKVDRKVFNPARIWKLYGTVAAKGDHTAERPHRVARVLVAPPEMGVVSAELLGELARWVAPAKASSPDGGGRAAAHSGVEALAGGRAARAFDLDAWISAHALDVTGPREWRGGRRWVFRACPWNAAHTDRSAYIAELPSGALAAGCHHDSCAGNDWASLRRVVDTRGGLASRETCGTSDTLRGTSDYLLDGGRTWRRIFRRERGELVESERKVIADFAVTVVEEARAEDGGVWFTLAGETAAGKPMRVSLPVEEFIAEKGLLAGLTAAAGASCGVRAGMAQHLRPAIQALSGEVACVRTFHRTGWAEVDGAPRFLIPGRAPEGVEVRLRKLPYSLSVCSARFSATDALKRALQTDAARDGFRALLRALEPERTTVVAALMFQAPLAKLAGWASERYAVFIAGRTGSLKTSFAQALMCLYGAGFLEDQYLLKFGEGATRNALLSYAEQARDLPLLVDNYKPNTGDGARGLVNLLHNLIEGAGRERLNRYAELQEARPIGCWPLLTGEDAPRGDAAALARLLVVPVRWNGSGNNAALAAAQAAAGEFPRLGAAWLDWLESAEGAAAAARAGAGFEGARAKWADRLRTVGSAAGAANPLRLATNLATNELTWGALAAHPLFADVALEFEAAHAAGLALLAGEMARQTAENVEAARFIDVLQQLLASGSHRLARRGDDGARDPRASEDVIGWHAPDGGAYLLPDLARRAVEQALGGDGLNRVSNEALYGQLEELGLIGTRDAGRRTKMVRTGQGRSVRVLHLAPAAIGALDDTGAET